ncbi:MAG: hypothetical protein CEE38_17480 [Planctomycetes bacterium B3_Pla]|nr:MAG: hypothetical protein CEE38_17480 [Planctomycetes bacterium B3_Pla]
MRARKHRTLILALLLEFILCSVGSTVEQRRFHSQANGYSLTIPEGWKQAPEDVMDQTFGAAFMEDPRSTFEFEAIFAKEWVNNLLTYPTLIVQIIRYPKNQQLTKEESHFFVEAFTEAITGSDVDDTEDAITEGIDKYGVANFRGMVSAVAANRVSFDKQTMVLKYSVEFDVERVGTVKQLVVGHVGRYAVVQLMFQCLASDWSHFENESNLMFNSFRFDVGMRYEDVSSAPPGIFDGLGRAFAQGISLALIAGALAIIAGVFKLGGKLIRPKK